MVIVAAEDIPLPTNRYDGVATVEEEPVTDGYVGTATSLRLGEVERGDDAAAATVDDIDDDAPIAEQGIGRH